jgi:membrane protease subunit HflK
VEAIEIADVKNPSEPGAVSQAFFEAQNAASVRNQLEQEGRTEADRIVSDARARRAELLAEARGYRERLVRSARADAAMLGELLPIYEESKDVKRILLDRFYERAIEEVMSNSPGAFLLHDGGEEMARELRVLLNRQPPPRLKPEQQPGGRSTAAPQ